MSTMKPDYFIAHNGLPNILLAPSRRLITQSKTSECDRVSGDQQQIHPLTRNNRLPGVNQQAHVMQRDSENNVKNRAIKESLRNSKTTKDLINQHIVKNSSWNHRIQTSFSPTPATPKCASTDNSECNRNAKRCSRVNSMDFRDNKLMQQRKYDSTIFRHDLPDRLALPPLPI